MRKRIAALLCVSLITGTLALIPTGAAAAGSEISVFDSLSDYTAQKGSGVPAGWISRDANTLKGVGVYLDEERNSRTMKINEGGEVVLPFGNNFNEGLLHISYDVKQIDDNGNNNYNKMLSASLYGHVDTDANGAPDYTHQYDPTYFANGGNPMHYMLTTGTNANGVPFGVFTDSWRWMGRRLYDKDKSFTEDTWHKIDIYLNQTPTAASAYSVYLDGEAIVGRTVTNGVYSDDITKAAFSNNRYVENFTGLILRGHAGLVATDSGYTASQTPDDAGYLIDNVYMQTYTGASDALALVADEMTEEGIPLAGGKVGVGFSEYVDRPATKSDITVKNSATGAVVSNYEVISSDQMQFVLEFDDTAIPAGQYTVSVSNVVGSVSGNPVTVYATFSTKAGIVIVDGQEVRIPWVENVVYETYDGRTETAKLGVSTLVQKIRVNFSAPVADSGLEDKITISGAGESLPYTYTMQNGNTTAELTLTKLLKGNTDYTVLVSDAITAQTSDKVSLQNPYKDSFTSKDDGSFELTSHSFQQYNATRLVRATLNLLKTDNQKRQCTVALASYRYTDNPSVKQLLALNYLPVEFTEDERVLSTYQIDTRYGTANELKFLVLEYPTQRVILSETIQIN